MWRCKQQPPQTGVTQGKRSLRVDDTGLRGFLLISGGPNESAARRVRTSRHAGGALAAAPAGYCMPLVSAPPALALLPAPNAGRRGREGLAARAR